MLFRPLNAREKGIRSTEVVDVVSPKEILTRHVADTKLTKKFTFDRTFDTESKQSEVYQTVVSPLIEEVLAGYNCTVFAYGQTGTGKTHTMIGPEIAELKSSWDDVSKVYFVSFINKVDQVQKFMDNGNKKMFFISEGVCNVSPHRGISPVRLLIYN